MGHDFPYPVHKRYPPLLPLTRSRLLSVLLVSDLTTIPIRVLYSEEHEKYMILDGRHRISSAIIKGIRTIDIMTEGTGQKKCEECNKVLTIIKKAKDGEVLCIECYENKCCPICHSWCGSNSVCCD